MTGIWWLLVVYVAGAVGTMLLWCYCSRDASPEWRRVDAVAVMSVVLWPISIEILALEAVRAAGQRRRFRERLRIINVARARKGWPLLEEE